MSLFKKDGIAVSIIAFGPAILGLIAVAAIAIYHIVGSLLH